MGYHRNSIGFLLAAAVVVATVVLSAGLPATFEPSVIDFLNTKSMLHWAELELGI